MSITAYHSSEEIENRIKALLDALNISEEELQRYASSYSLKDREFSAWSEIESLRWLQGAA